MSLPLLSWNGVGPCTLENVWKHFNDCTVLIQLYVSLSLYCVCLHVFCVFCVFFFYGPFGVPELKCTYLLTYLNTLQRCICVALYVLDGLPNLLMTRLRTHE